MKYTTILNNEMYEVEILKDGAVLVNGERHEVDFLALDESLYSIIQNNRSQDMAIDEDQGNYQVLVDGRLYEAQVLDQRTMLMMARKGGLMIGSGEVTAPMPGLVVEIPVSVGDSVEAGQTVVVLESMKMQNELKAPISGVIESVQTEAGKSVDKNAVLLVISDDSEE
jgi:biotin carboxyl carrier protein